MWWVLLKGKSWVRSGSCTIYFLKYPLMNSLNVNHFHSLFILLMISTSHLFHIPAASEVSSVATASSSFFAELNEEQLRKLLKSPTVEPDSTKKSVAYLKRFLVARPALAQLACELIWKLSDNGIFLLCLVSLMHILYYLLLLDENRRQIAQYGGIQALLKAIRKYYQTDREMTRKAFRALVTLIVEGFIITFRSLKSSSHIRW